MSSFFLKGKSRKLSRKRGDKVNKVKTKRAEVKHNLENHKDSSESDLELKKFSEPEESESDHETPEQKKLRLSKKYLEEIEKEEAKRTEQKQVDRDLIEERVKRDYLEQQGKLKVALADKLDKCEQPRVCFVRCREHRLPVTCLCVSSDGSYVYSGSKCSSLIKWSTSNKSKLVTVTHKSNNCVKGSVISIAISTDSKFLAVADESNEIKVWDPITLKLIHTFKGHKDIVTGVVFRKDTHDLYSCSKDRSIKIWSLDEMSYVETLFGHQSPITSIDALSRERAITAGGRDNTVRIWKIAEESQLIFNGPPASLDEVKLLDEEHFVSGSDNGSIGVWSVLKKKPLCTVVEAHGKLNEVPRWITSIATIHNSDVFASGSHNDSIKIWKIADMYKSVTNIISIPLNGFVNCMQFSEGGRRLHAALGQEHKAGRWWRVKDAKNSLLLIDFNLNDVR